MMVVMSLTRHRHRLLIQTEIVLVHKDDFLTLAVTQSILSSISDSIKQRPSRLMQQVPSGDLLTFVVVILQSYRDKTNAFALFLLVTF